ncbi:MAG TPA: hypothetical protein VK787_12360, partial [Puia sp.]|nr:hypothetical protein [Puia sp.]
MRKLFSLLLLATCFFSFAQNKITVIKAGKLIDTENGKVLNDQIIIIYNDTIKAVGSNLEIPKDTKIIDLS